MQVDDALLARLESLAKIKIDDDKKESFKRELSQIIEKMHSLQDIDTENITLSNNEKTPLRADEPSNSNIRDKILQGTRCDEDGDYFVVPKVIE